MSYELISVLAIFFSYYVILNKVKILNEDRSISKHKNFILSKKSPILIGGSFLLTIIIIFSNYNFFPIKFSLLLIFLLGAFSDKNFLPNPKLRLILQLIVIIYTIHILDLKISDLRIDLFNQVLQYPINNLLFTTFCLAIFVNGSNFMDGLNGLLIGYSILIFVSVLYVNYNYLDSSIVDLRFTYTLIFSLVILFIGNFFGYVYLGDNGSYLLSFFIGIYLVSFFMSNNFLSPYYIATILWYPSFENFFSLIRRLLSKKSVSSADNNHFHQLLYSLVRNFKFFGRNIEFDNSFASVIILIFNIPGFIISSNNPLNTKIQIYIILINITLYLIFYFMLLKKFKNKQS